MSRNGRSETTKEGMVPTSYGLREIVAGGENGETHMIWMGPLYASSELYHESNNLICC